MKCVFHLEDHDVFRQSLAHLLDEEPDVEVVGQAREVKEAKRSVQEDIEDIDVAVVDLLLPDAFGVDFIREVHRARPELPILVVTIAREKEIHDWARAMGATEVLTKDAPLEEIIAAIKRLGKG